MQIPQSIIEQLNEKADLVAIIKKHTPLKPNGKEFKGCCPFHGEKTPSFFVNPDTNLYYCFGCGAKGNAISFLVDYERQTFMEALKTLSEQTGIDLPKEDGQKYRYPRTPSNAPTPPTQVYVNKLNHTPPNNSNPNTPVASSPNPTLSPLSGEPPSLASLPASQTNPQIHLATSPASSPILPAPSLAQPTGDLYSLLNAVNHHYQTMLKNTPSAYRYFANRGITDETMAIFELGYAPNDWQHLQKAFPNDVEGLRMLGLIRTSQKGKEFDLFRDRVMFPIKDKQGRVVGFAGRALDDDTLPKYVNSSDSVVFQKNHILYGYYESRQQKAENWLVVEGYMDAIALYQAGIFGAVAPMGTAINEGQIAQLLKFNDALTLCFDGDNAGQKAAMRALEVAMPVLTDGKSLKFLTLPDNHDPDTYIKVHGKDKMLEAIGAALSMSDYLYQIMASRYELTYPEQKASAMRDVKALLEKLPKGASLRSWLNSDFYYRLRGNSTKKSTPTNYQTKQLDSITQLCLCLLYCPPLASQINFGQSLMANDPLAQFYANTGLAMSHMPLEPKFAEFNLITPALPSWDNFCYHQDEHGQSLNALGQLIVLIQNALPSLCYPPNTPIHHPNLVWANALFLLGAMGATPTQKTLSKHWQGFFDTMSESDNGNNIKLLFDELLSQLIIWHIRHESATHLLVSQLHKKRLTCLENWRKHHNLMLEQLR